MANRRNDAGWWIQIGGDASSLPLLERLDEAGLSILLVEPLPDAPGDTFAARTVRRPLCDLAGIRNEARLLATRGRILGVDTCRTDGDALRAVGAIRSDHDLPGRDLEAMEAFLARSAWKKILVDAGIPTPESAILESPIELDRFLGVHPSALLRPATGARGSAGVSRARIGDPRNRELFDEARLVSDSDLVRAEAFVAGEAHAIDGFVQGGRFVMLAFGRKFSMRHLRGTLPTGIAWGTDREDTSARSSPRWGEVEARIQRVAEALGGDDGFLSLDLLDDGETMHVADLRPHLGRASTRGLAFAGHDPATIALALALGEATPDGSIAGDARRGFAQRFCYAGSNGPLVDPRATQTDSAERKGWQQRRVTDARIEVALDRRFGDMVERPAAADDRVASVLVEARDRNTAWMRANEIDPDTIFEIDEPKPEPRSSAPPVWPMSPPRS